MKNSIIKMLDRLGPKKIVVVSSAPQIRYPDCYGIDMARNHDLVAFRAAIELLEENNMEHVIDEVYIKCKEAVENPSMETENHVKKIYKPFSATQLADKISSIVKPEGLNAELKIIFQKIEDLHEACPNHTGDWYFSGDYPTPGGNRVSCRAFVNYIEGINQRAY